MSIVIKFLFLFLGVGLFLDTSTAYAAQNFTVDFNPKSLVLEANGVSTVTVTNCVGTINLVYNYNGAASESTQDFLGISQFNSDGKAISGILKPSRSGSYHIKAYCGGITPGNDKTPGALTVTSNSAITDAPKNLQIDTANESYLNIKWDSVDKADMYDIVYTDPAGVANTLASNINRTSISGLPADTSYTISVKGCKSGKSACGPAATITAKTIKPLPVDACCKAGDTWNGGLCQPAAGTGGSQYLDYCSSRGLVCNSSTSKCLSASGLPPAPAPPPPPAISYAGTKTSVGIPCNGGGILTAIGCVPTQPTAFMEGLLKFITRAAGGIALLLMAVASIQMITSQGNPEGLKKAHSRFTSAIVGLLFIIFSILLMQIIGVNILGLPGFS